MKKLFLLAIPALLLASKSASAQFDKTLTASDSSALESLAAQPDSIRGSILAACGEPGMLVKIEALQKNTSEAFRNLLEAHSKQEQAKLWELSRYPALVNEISTGGKKTKEELESISRKYPENIRKTATEFGHSHYETLVSMNTLYNNSQQEFKKLIAAYPSGIQDAYLMLGRHPDALSTLSSNVHTAVILGNLYAADKQKAMQALDSIHAVSKKQAAENFNEWKNGLESNPAAKKEMEQAAADFRKEYENPDGDNADDVYSPAGQGDQKKEVVVNTTIVNYVAPPYPYWFGYPWWYDYPYWYPYPVWYNWGFYYGPAGIVYTGMPSPFFMHWYFYHPYHHYYYYHFSDYCLGYHFAHYGPRQQHTGFNSVMHRWTETNQAHLPRGYFNNDPQRPARMRELGKFEMDYHNSTKGMFGRNITRPEFLQNNAVHYPSINPVIKQPHFNQPIKYPTQENPVKFDMNIPHRMPRPVVPGGGGRGGSAPAPRGGRPR